MRRLLVRYGVAMASVVLVAFLVPLGLLARTLAAERAVDAGRQDAQGVARFAGGISEDRALLEAAVLAVNSGARRTTAFLPDGSTVGAPSERTAAVQVAEGGTALTARIDGGVELVVPVGAGDGLTVVRTVVPDAELSEGVRESWLVLAALGLVLLGGTALAGDRIAARLSRSVLDLSRVAELLGAGDLSARVEPSGPPEVASVGRVLNGLGAQVSGLVAAERELVADLSHRLRTPITALRLDADLLSDAQEREQIAAHVEELVHAVDAVVWTARHPRRDVPGARCDAVRAVRARAAFWTVLAADQGRDLQLHLPDAPHEVATTAQDLGAALDVLVDNVFSHTPERTPFTLRVEVREGGGPLVRVVVEDDGPGLASPDLAERGRSGAGSTGLGLDVARRTAEGAGGSLRLESGPAGGARVVLEMPALPPGS